MRGISWLWLPLKSNFNSLPRLTICWNETDWSKHPSWRAWLGCMPSTGCFKQMIIYRMAKIKHATLAPQARPAGEILNYSLSCFFGILSMIIHCNNQIQRLLRSVELSYLTRVSANVGKVANITYLSTLVSANTKVQCKSLLTTSEMLECEGKVCKICCYLFNGWLKCFACPGIYNITMVFIVSCFLSCAHVRVKYLQTVIIE